MAGRKAKVYEELRADISIESGSGMSYVLKGVQMICPSCSSKNVRSNGTRPLKNTRIPAIICKNPDCHAGPKNTPRQFSPHKSKAIQDMLSEHLNQMLRQVYLEGAKAKTVAAAYGVSETFVSFLRDDLDAVIEQGIVKDELVDVKTDDDAASIDEDFFKIGSEAVYVIIVRGYKSRKVLGLNVSLTRTESDIRKAFDEAQANSQNQLNIITCDAWGATRKMAHELMRPVTLIIHKHKKPYDKAVIERVEYQGTDRIITKVGIQTDIFTRRAKREYMHQTTVESTVASPPGHLGRPKGSKNKGKYGAKKNNRQKNGDQKDSSTYSRLELKPTFVSSLVKND
ncbi:MAG: hypothetical protein Q6370_023600 [Candidatus Sigynarchaeota archaeon]